MRKLKYFIVSLVLLTLVASCIKKSEVELVFESLFENQNLNEVTEDLDFPTEVDGVSIVYVSGQPSVINDQGKVTPKNVDTVVEVMIILSKGEEQLQKRIQITVLKLSVNLEDIYSNIFKDYDLDKVSTNLNLPTLVDGVMIKYESSNENIISNTGQITKTHENQYAIMTITLTFENHVLEKTQLITVLLDQELLLNHVYNNLFNDIDLNNIASDITLKTFVSGVGITYSSNQPEVFSNTGIVNRGTMDVTVTVNVSLIYRSTLLEKSVTVVVLKDPKLLINDVFDGLFTEVDLDNVTSNLNLKNNVDGVSITYSSSKPTVLSDNGIVNRGSKDESVVLTVNLEAEGTLRSKVVFLTVLKQDMLYLVDELDKFITSGITPVGEQNVLIIPINFTDYYFSNDDLMRLDLSFFGTSEETGWESVQSYYDKSSYGNFSFNGTILDPFQTNKPSTYYASKYNSGIDADYEIIKAALDYYDPTIDFSLYDNNKDGYIDGLYFIYATPVSYEEGTGSPNESELWWAYVYQYLTEDYEYYDGVEANYYLWAGKDFMDEALVYDDYTDVIVPVNATTYIHETGHMLGLYDYYDYDPDKGPDGGLGGADMMDYTVGDHNSFSKIILNWVDPIIVNNESRTLTINSFTETGDVILVSSNFTNSYFDEYFLIELYTPTHLNEAHAGYNGLFSISGIRIFHVNAQINPNQEDNYMLFLYDNSYTTTKILKPIEADKDNSIEYYGIAEDSDLFQVGDKFGQSTNYQLRNGQTVNFNIEILSITNNQAEVKITFN